MYLTDYPLLLIKTNVTSLNLFLHKVGVLASRVNSPSINKLINDCSNKDKFENKVVTNLPTHPPIFTYTLRFIFIYLFIFLYPYGDKQVLINLQKVLTLICKNCEFSLSIPQRGQVGKKPIPF